MMIAALLLVFLLVIVLMLIGSARQVPWEARLLRVHAGVAGKAEWMAPEKVVEEVRRDYLAAVNWLQESVLGQWMPQWNAAPTFLSGAFLRRYQMILMDYRTNGQPRCVGILRADHFVEVRHFSEDGQRCLVIDRQSVRRMATYDARTHTRLHTQDLGDGTLVYQMVYDSGTRRWKIENFIQELPTGWGSHNRRIRLLSALPAAIGRDH
ncbi:MAG: hypothetical protein HXY40_03760 [Chloroflexi bacterium]|nr:hypothetical protein [Chloroflexota bacterium]